MFFQAFWCTAAVERWLYASNDHFMPRCAAAGQPAKPKHPLTDMPLPGDVTVVSYFPEHPNKRLPAGPKA